MRYRWLAVGGCTLRNLRRIELLLNRSIDGSSSALFHTCLTFDVTIAKVPTTEELWSSDTNGRESEWLVLDKIRPRLLWAGYLICIDQDYPAQKFYKGNTRQVSFSGVELTDLVKQGWLKFPTKARLDRTPAVEGILVSHNKERLT